MPTYKNLKAGYICDSVSKIIKDYKNEETRTVEELNKIDGLLKYVSSFDVLFPYEHKLNYEKLHPILAVANNIITRGLPTKVPLIVEQTFVKCGLINDNKKEFEFEFSKTKNELDYQTVFELLHIVEPKLLISKEKYGGDLGSDYEWYFLQNTLRKYPYLKQILQSQRSFASINSEVHGSKSVDFSYSSPYLHTDNDGIYNGTRGFILEVDGYYHHQQYDYQLYDKYRDEKAAEAGFETLRFTNLKETKTFISLDKLFGSSSYQVYNKNYERNVNDFLDAYGLLFIPLAVARIQKTLVEHLLAQTKLFEKKTIRIAIVERDVPCAALALVDFEKIITNLNALLTDEHKISIPKFELTVFQNEKWFFNEKLHLCKNLKTAATFKHYDFDIVIDHAILRRSNIYNENDVFSHCKKAIKIRSAHFVDNSYGNARKFYCADLLNYQKLVEKQDDSSYLPIEKYTENINYFIQNIFRKKKYRDGQLPIISRALQLKPVIGLLPTGGGKSLTFQLSAFLQAGLCLIVDPIKSLMEDQVRVLKENWIDCCAYINSNLERKEKQKRFIDFRYGETFLMFVSPERFVMQEFRDIVKNIHKYFGLAFSYCVIDEVHCVSEWGHDFRTTYLMLGKNAQKFLPTKSQKKVSLIGLTATASFDVLADIERELDIKHDDVANAIIAIENTIRPELFFRIIDVTGTKDRKKMLEERMKMLEERKKVSEERKKMLEERKKMLEKRKEMLNNDFEQMKENLLKINKEDILRESQKHHFDEFEKRDFATKETAKNKEESTIEFEYNPKYLLNNETLKKKTHNDLSAIIFCSTKENKLYKNGVLNVYKSLKSAPNNAGFYFGVDEYGKKGSKEGQKEVQKHFEDFTSNKINHIVCTKAFGMGIDKADIRSTYHFYYSNSLESLVQEVGRAGRDKKVALANILVSTNKVYRLSPLCLRKENKDDENDNIITNSFTRKAIRWNLLGKDFESEKEIKDKIEKTINGLNSYYTPDTEKRRLIARLNKFFDGSYSDRDTHKFFYKSNFKGIDAEKSQFYNLFKKHEFEKAKAIEGQDTLINKFNNHAKNNEYFNFTIASNKIYPDVAKEICNLLEVSPKEKLYKTKTYKEKIDDAKKYAFDFEDFILRLEEIDEKFKTKTIDANKRKWLRFRYHRDRTKNDTGRLIYRMHCMGFLVDYEIDYQKNHLHKCTFKKVDDIEYYLKEIEKYFRRYSSEQNALEQIKEVRKRCTKSSVIENILECLYYLSEFAYGEIVSKRRRATDEIESLLNRSISEEPYKNDWFEQNKHIKEEIYFYFNAKYARKGFKIKGEAFSLLDDYKPKSPEKPLPKREILDKYLKVFELEGTAQNNYKHMIGSCKKILRSLTESDLKKEWVLRLLKAFAMYAVNNQSYISEANGELETGFLKLYDDTAFHQDNFSEIKSIFDYYFEELRKNIEPKNESFKHIKLIHLKLLQQFQTLEIEKLIKKSKEQLFN